MGLPMAATPLIEVKYILEDLTVTCKQHSRQICCSGICWRRLAERLLIQVFSLGD